MNTLPPQAYFQQLHACLQWQTHKLQELEAKIAQLQQEVDALKKQRTMTVEKIEYKFDQLKIEKLDGTLHIGISPDVGKSIEDFSVDGQEVQTSQLCSDVRTRIRKRIDDYLEQFGRSYIHSLENDYRIVLGNDYVTMMIQDLKGQMDKRIDHYMASMTEDVSSASAQQAKEEKIVDKIQSDIKAAIEHHLELKKK